MYSSYSFLTSALAGGEWLKNILKQSKFIEVITCSNEVSNECFNYEDNKYVKCYITQCWQSVLGYMISG
jgi:hypothetical protein